MHKNNTLLIFLCFLFRVSFVEVYSERVEDLLTTYAYPDTPGLAPASAPASVPAMSPDMPPAQEMPRLPPLKLMSDAGGRVVWCGATEVTVTKMEEVCGGNGGSGSGDGGGGSRDGGDWRDR